MKKILFLVIVVIVVLSLIFIYRYKKESSISDIITFHYSYSTGTMINSYVYYDLSCKNEKCIAIIKPNNMAEDEKLETIVDFKIKEKLENILKKYHVENWDGFNKNDKNVLDGDSFSMNITMKNSDIKASGYMKWPKNYNQVTNEIDSLFMEIYNKNLEEE